MYSAGVYPRVCGGTGGKNRCRGRPEGLSPRVRGNQTPIPALILLSGSIPACAGEPPYIRREFERLGVYPRVCGGTLVYRGIKVLYRGLSPRVRGNLWL